MKDIQRMNVPSTKKTVEHVFVETEVNSKKTGESNGRNVSVCFSAVRKLSNVKHWFLQTPIYKKLAIILHLDTNIIKSDFNKNLNCASKALADGDGFKLLMSLKHARSNLINDRKRLGKEYGIDNFSKAIGDWIKLLKKQEGGRWDALSEQIKNSSSTLNLLSAAIKDLNDSMSMMEISSLQRSLVSISTIYVDTMARAALSGSDDNESENSNLNDAVYRSWDEAKSNHERYPSIVNDLQKAVSKM